jgi:two-component system, cell cycle sensor histidine kinase and response regulator CckA
MALAIKLGSRWWSALAGIAISFAVFVCAWLLLDSDLDLRAHKDPELDPSISKALVRKSYDWSFNLTRFAQPDISASDVVIVYIDEVSMRYFQQPLRVPMDRELHARLLNRLKQEGAKAAVFDLVFSDPGPSPESDEFFARAIAENGGVILGVDYNPQEEPEPGIVLRSLTPNYSPFAEAAAGSGLVMNHPDGDFIARRHFHAFDRKEDIPDAPPSLSWATARFLKLKLTRDPAEQQKKRWIWYYGPAQTIPHVTYKYALETAPPGFFKDKVVFIGARPMTTGLVEKRDELRNPFPPREESYRDYPFMPAVELHATEFLNIKRGEWLTEPSRAARTAILALAAVILGLGLSRLRPLIATAVATGAGVATVLSAQAVFVWQHLWFPWLIIVVIQIPLALLGAIIYRSLEWFVQRRRLEEERRRADAQIREQAALLDKAQDAIIVHDLEWRPVYWNQSAEKLYGWTAEEMRHKDLRDEVYQTGEAKLLEVFQTVLNTGEWLGELKQTTKAGKTITVHSRWTLVRNETGLPKSIFVINTDVTEQRLLEAQFLRTQRMESIGTLAGGIAHDLNNVLSPIVMGVELLKLKTTDEHSQKLLTTMAGSARRGADMVKQVLTFARGDEGERTLLQVKHLIREMQKIARETFPKTITIDVEVDNVRPILGDSTQIHQILLNLCVNARDAMPNGGNILIECKDAALTRAEADKFVGAKPIAYVLMSVRDTGAGIPPEIIDRIFEPFFTTKEIGKGTGLGLSTVLSIIKSHGGFLDLRSEPGKGTTFNVYLPVAELTTTLPSTPALPADLRGKGELVMVVDDEPALREVTQALLTENGYTCVGASNGGDALELYRKCRAKLKIVLMDIMMPVMDGPSAIKALKQTQPDLKIVATSGLTVNDTVSQQLASAGIPFLPKPYNAERLLKALRNALSADCIRN